MEKLSPGEFNYLIKVTQPVCVWSKLKVTHYTQICKTCIHLTCNRAHLILDEIPADSSTNLNVFLTHISSSSSPFQFKMVICNSTPYWGSFLHPSLT